MIANGEFVAELVDAGAKGLAAIVADRLLERKPALADRYGPEARAAWRESTWSRLGYLAAALRLGSPAVLAEQLTWARGAHEARGGPEAGADFDDSMRLLREVLLEELPGEPGVLAASCIDRALQAAAPLRSGGGLKMPDHRLAAEFLLAVLEGDRRKASRIVLDAVEPGSGGPAMTVRQVYLDVLIPAQCELGRMWHLNEIGVAEEHFATATTQLVMSQLYSHLPFAPSNGKVVVAASVEGNAHDVAVRMLGDLLESAGWRTVYLGASVPAPDLASAAQHFRADLVALSAGLGSQLPAVAAAVEQIRMIARPTRVLVGGGAFPATADPAGPPLWKRLGADGFAPSLDAGVAEAARLVGLSK